MSLEELRRTLEAEGRARAEAIRQQADEETARIRADANDARTRALSRAMHDAEVALRRQLGVRLAAARGQAQQRVLAARQTLLERIFDDARAVLAEALDDPAARDALVARAASALQYMPEGPAEIRCSDGVAPVLAQALAGREGLRIDVDGDMAAGFRVRGAGGAVEVDATLETLLEIHRPTLAIEVLHRLDAEPAP